MAIPAIINAAANQAGSNDTTVQQAWQQAVNEILIPSIAGMVVNTSIQTMQLGQQVAAKIREDQQS